MQVIAGAPNIVRGGSHSGNVAAADLLASEAVDAFASDYVPTSLVEAAFQLRAIRIGLPRADRHGQRTAGAAGRTDGPRPPRTGSARRLVRVRLHDTLAGRAPGLARRANAWHDGAGVARRGLLRAAAG